MTAGWERRPARAAGRGGRPTLVDPNVAMRGSAARRAAAGEPPPEPRVHGEEGPAAVEARSGPSAVAILRCASRGGGGRPGGA
jgi:hypothetical protein